MMRRPRCRKTRAVLRLTRTALYVLGDFARAAVEPLGRFARGLPAAYRETWRRA